MTITNVAVTMSISAAISVIALTISVTPTHGQIRTVLGVNIEAWSISSGHLGGATGRGGASISLASSSDRAAIRLVGAHVPQGDVEPGWTVLVVEIDPAVVRVDRLSLAARLIGGAHYMQVANRHRAIEGCRPEIGCMFEAPALAQGWSSLAGVAGAMGVNVTDRFLVSGAIALTRLMGGSNSGEALPRITAGIEYAVR